MREGCGLNRILIDFCRRHRSPLLLISLAGIVSGLGLVWLPLRLGSLIDALAPASAHDSSLDLPAMLLLYLGLIALVQLCQFAKRLAIRRHVHRLATDLREQLLQSILSQAYPEWERHSVGDLMARLVGDIGQISDVLIAAGNEIWDTLLPIGAYLFALARLDGRILLSASLPLPLLFLCYGMSRRYLLANAQHLRSATGLAQHSLRGFLASIATLRLFGREQVTISGVMQAWTQLARASIRENAGRQILQPVYSAISGLALLIVLMRGGEHLRSGSWSLGSFNAYLVLFSAFAAKLIAALSLLTRVRAAQASWQRVQELLKPAPQEESASADVRVHPPSAHSLSVRELCYRQNGQTLLEGISFTAQQGEIIGITGAIGSGKSLLAHVLAGLYPADGEIVVDGKALQQFSEAERQSLIAYADHEQFLFSMSLAENIQLGREPDHRNLAYALQFSTLANDLRAFQSGIATPVGEQGALVSGGQRQRIALARAFYRDSSILILDNPFSDIDIATEREIMQGLRQLAEGRIILLCSHRLTALAHSDLILVLDKGQVIQSGRHVELIEQEGLYRDIYLAQDFLAQRRFADEAVANSAETN